MLGRKTVINALSKCSQKSSIILGQPIVTFPFKCKFFLLFQFNFATPAAKRRVARLKIN